MNGRRFAWLGLGGLAATVGGCQLVSGLSGYQDSGGTATGAGGAMSTSSAAGTTSAGGAGGASAVDATAAGTGGATATSGTGCGPTEQICDMQAGCVDVSGSATNCGSCGHVCTALDGTPAGCWQSRCLPVAVSDAYDAATPITVIAADPATPGVYWAVGKASSQLHGIDTSGAHHDLVSIGARVGGLATRGSLVFYTANVAIASGLYEWDVPGNGSKPRQLVAKLTSVGAVVSGDGQNVVWGAGLLAQDGGPWNIFCSHLVSMTNAAPFSNDAPALLVADDVNVYWPYSTNQFNTLVSAIGLQDSPIQGSFNPPDYIAADADSGKSGYLYEIWSGSLYRFHKNSGAMQIPESKPGVTIAKPTGLVVTPDGSAVYWLEDSDDGSANGKLMRSLGWDQAPTTWVDNLNHPDNLAMDDTRLYYSAQVSVLDKKTQVYSVDR